MRKASLAIISAAVMLWGAATAQGAGGLEIGVGLSTNKEAYAAGAEAARIALGGVKNPKALLVFDALRQDHEQLLAGISSVSESIPFYGCSTEGVITHLGTPEEEAVGVLALGGKDIRVWPAMIKLGECAEMGGRELAGQYPKVQSPPGGVVILFGKLSQQLVEGIQQVLGSNFPIVGGTAAAGLGKGAGGAIYYDGQIVDNGVCGILLEGGLVRLRQMGGGQRGSGKRHVLNITQECGKQIVKDVGPEPISLLLAFACISVKLEVGNAQEAGNALKTAIGKNVPMIGFYAWGEVGRRQAGQQCSLTGHTISLCAIGENGSKDNMGEKR